jgi:hypothetical protein
VDERVDDHVPLGDVGVHVVLVPERERVDLHLAALAVPADGRRVGPARAFVAAQTGAPREVRLERVVQRDDLAHRAAEVGVAGVQALAVQLVLLGDGDRRLHGDDVDVELGGHAVAGLQRLREVVPGVEEDHVDLLRQHVGGEAGEHRVAHRGRQGEPGPERLPRPAQHVVRQCALEVTAGLPGESLELRGREVPAERERHEVASWFSVVVVPIKRRFHTRRQEPQRYPEDSSPCGRMFSSPQYGQ